MQDYLIRGTASDGKLRVFAINTTETVEELRRRHGTWPTATAALGRAVTAGAMMGAMLKGDEKLTIQIKGNGPLGQIVVDANARGEVRGYVDNPQVHLPSNAMGKLDVAGAVGTEGFIYVIKDLGLREPYRGSVPIVSGELAEDFTYYFATSEQIPSAVSLGVLVNADGSVRHAGGFIIQLLPGLTDEEITQLENKLGQLAPMTTMLDQGMPLERIVHEVVESAEILGRMEVRFRCKCSREKVENTLISLGAEEIEKMLEETGNAEVICHFCNETYVFDETDLKRIMDNISRS